MLLVELLLREGRHDRAVAVAEEALAGAKDDPTAIELSARARLAAGDAKSAIALFSRLAATRPGDPRASFELGKAELRAGMTDQANATLRRALQLQSERDEARNMPLFVVSIQRDLQLLQEMEATRKANLATLGRTGASSSEYELWKTPWSASPP